MSVRGDHEKALAVAKRYAAPSAPTELVFERDVRALSEAYISLREAAQKVLLLPTPAEPDLGLESPDEDPEVLEFAVRRHDVLLDVRENPSGFWSIDVSIDATNGPEQAFADLAHLAKRARRAVLRHLGVDVEG